MVPVRTFAVIGVLLFATSLFAVELQPFPGKVSDWRGQQRHDYQIAGKNVIVVQPKEPAAGRPWIWRGEFFDAFADADAALVKRGWHLVYLSVPNLFGAPRAMREWEACYDHLVQKHGLHPQPGLIGLSRGALYCMAWAAEHPDRTLAVYLDNGVCDFKSWPGGKVTGSGAGPGSQNEWKNLLAAFDFPDDAAALAYRGNPIDRLEPLAKAKIPLLLVYGDADRVVPHRENSEIVFDRYQQLHGPVTRIVKPGQDHHPHGLTDVTPVVEFFERALRERQK